MTGTVSKRRGCAAAMVTALAVLAANNAEGRRTVSDISFMTATPRVSHLFFSPFGTGLLRSAVEPGVEGWARYYFSPHSATAQGLKLALRYHLIGLGRHRPPGAGDQLDVHLRAGYRFQHISNGHRSNPNRGFNSDSGVGGVSFHFK